MVLNYIWIAFFLIGFVVAIAKTFQNPDVPILNEMVQEIFRVCESSVMDLALPLAGVLAFWMGMMKIAEHGGAINTLSRVVSPFLSRIMKGVPKGHPAHGAMVMNFSANMLGLDNAATPMGLKAMEELQSINPDPKRASDAQIMFLVLNTSGLTIIPTSILAYRQVAGATDPTDVFLPILLATTCSTLVGFITVAAIQRLSLLNKVVMGYMVGIAAFLGLFVASLASLSHAEIGKAGNIISGGLIILVIGSFLLLGLRKKLNVYDSFIEGAKEGIQVAIKVIPYLVAILAAIAVFRSSGAMDYLLDGIRWFIGLFTADTSFTDALPVGLMKPLSGSGARGLMLDTWGAANEAGIRPMVDSYTGYLASVMQGSTETTFYVLAVYFGSVGIRNTRYALGAGLIADLAGIVASVIFASLFYA
jgi:spore maturation protein SpmA